MEGTSISGWVLFLYEQTVIRAGGPSGGLVEREREREWVESCVCVCVRRDEITLRG